MRAHEQRRTRIGHYCATATALSLVAVSIALQSIWLTILGIVVGYAIALTSHRLGEGSKSLARQSGVWRDCGLQDVLARLDRRAGG